MIINVVGDFVKLLNQLPKNNGLVVGCTLHMV